MEGIVARIPFEHGRLDGIPIQFYRMTGTVTVSRTYYPVYTDGWLSYIDGSLSWEIQARLSSSARSSVTYPDLLGVPQRFESEKVSGTVRIMAITDDGEMVLAGDGKLEGFDEVE